MKDIKDKTIKELIDDLHKIDDKRSKLDEVENIIIYELWERIPSLKESYLFQPKGKTKVKEQERI
ncbi:MAG: hypothetical protein V8Q71_00145 [Bacilli bacterium]